jgi:hypothetical protein
MNPASDVDAEDVLDDQREVAKLRYTCEACGLRLSVEPGQRGELDRLVRAHLNTAGERFSTPCAEDTIFEERVYSDGSTEAI